jgi:hypothetical protein
MLHLSKKIVFTSVLLLVFLSNGFGQTDVPPVRIIYFTPSDMEPIPDREERLGRVMRCVQDFYRKGMELHGYGPKTFALEWNTPEKLKLYEVRGKKKQEEYGRDDFFVVRNEVIEVLNAQYGMDVNREYLVIFQLLLKREGDNSIELGPYAGMGTAVSGTALVYDDERLDANLLTSKEPGGFYHNPCSLGQFNTHYIGGVAHEMGHAFSLPHVCEWNSQRPQMGNALMGSGNHTFGKELRNEGQGTFLHETSALRLSGVRAFAGDTPDNRNRTNWMIEALAANEGRNENNLRTITLSGRITASPKLLGIIAYNDNMNIASDYDAKAWMTTNLQDGRFSITMDELELVPYQLRLVGVHENGEISQLAVDYVVTSGTINFDAINEMVAEDRIFRLFRDKKANEIKSVADNPAESNMIRRKAKHLVTLLSEPTLVDVAKFAKKVKTADLTTAKFDVENTGWLGVYRGPTAPDDILIRIGNELYESGLYAHAPSNYTVDLGGVWKTLTIGYGLQDGHDGAVRFIIRCDDKEVFRSDVVKDHIVRTKILPLEKVRKLELITESAQQGNAGAWGIWVNPLITR